MSKYRLLYYLCPFLEIANLRYTGPGLGSWPCKATRYYCAVAAIILTLTSANLTQVVALLVVDGGNLYAPVVLEIIFREPLACQGAERRCFDIIADRAATLVLDYHDSIPPTIRYTSLQ